MPNEDFCWNDEPTDYDGMYYNLNPIFHRTHENLLYDLTEKGFL